MQESGEIKKREYKETQRGVFLPADHFFSRVFLASLLFGLVALLCAYLFGQNNLDQFFVSFHLMWVFFISIVIGSIFFVLIQYATKAAWSVTIRRSAETIAFTMPIFFLFFGFMCVGGHSIYHAWMSPEALANPEIRNKSWYLNSAFFYTRSFVYVLLFAIAGLRFARGSLKQDHEQGRYKTSIQLQHCSYLWLGILGFVVTFASIDWIMTLTPTWSSTIFGLYFFAGSYVACLCVLTIIAVSLRGVQGLKPFFHTEHIHDFGKLIFGHSIFWAYAGFCQYLLIWYGNLPEETFWYEMRQQHDWFWVWSLLCVGHFVVPLILLMARSAKRSARWLVFVAVWVLAMHFVDIVWLIQPAFYHGPLFSLVDIFWFLAFFGILLAAFSWRLRKISVIPVQDPLLKESLTYTQV